MAAGYPNLFCRLGIKLQKSRVLFDVLGSRTFNVSGLFFLRHAEVFGPRYVSRLGQHVPIDMGRNRQGKNCKLLTVFRFRTLDCLELLVQVLMISQIRTLWLDYQAQLPCCQQKSCGPVGARGLSKVCLLL